MAQKILYSFFLMIMSPVMGILMGFRGSSKQVKKAILILFITFYGSLIFLHPGSDGFVHLSNVDYYVGLSFADFFSDLVDIITFQEGSNRQSDVYIVMLSYFVGGILGFPKLFFVFVSFIYAYFFVGSLFKIIDLNPNYKYTWVFYGFIIVFILWKNIEGINTVRTWTGLWILFYAALSYFQTKKIKYAILMFVPPLIHFGYFIMVIPALVVLFAGSRPYIYASLFALSFFVNLINPQTAANEISETSEVAGNAVKGYYVEEQQTVGQKLEASSQSNFYRQTSKAGFQNFSISALAVIIILSGYYFGKMNRIEAGLFSIGLLTKVLATATWFIFALSNRSHIIAGLFVLAAFVLIAQRGLISNNQGRFAYIRKVSFTLICISFLPFVLMKVSMLMDFISLYLFYTPFVVWIFSDVNISIKETILLLF